MNNLKSFLIFLRRNKGYTFINLFGLSVALMFVILIANYSYNELTVDKGVTKANRIYAIASEQYLATGFWNGQKLHSRYPEIENYCATILYRDMSIKANETTFNVPYLCADTSFFSMFSVELIEGDKKNALISTDNVIISQSFARKVFGNESPIGKSIKFVEEDGKERIISGIIRDFDNSIFPRFDLLLNPMVMRNYNSGIVDENMNNAGSSAVFLLARPGADLSSKAEEFATYFKEYFWPYQGGSLKIVNLIPFKKIYHSPYLSFTLRKGESSLLVILISVGVLILLFSVVNYINLTTAQTGFRAKEMATRRLLGSTRSALFFTLIIESFVMCTVAFIIALLMAIAATPFTNSILHCNIMLSSNLTLNAVLAYIGVISLLSIISGVIPAYIITNFKPIEIVHGTFHHKTSMIYSKLLIGFQNIITTALIGCSITMICQVKHLISAPLGYSIDNIVDIPTWGTFRDYAQIKELSTKLEQLPCVDYIALGCGTPLNGGNNNTLNYGPDRMVSFQVLYGDSAYFNMLNFRLKRNNQLAGNYAFFNEYTFKDLEISENEDVIRIGSNHEFEYIIGGIYYDFTIRSMLWKSTSCMLFNVKNFDDVNNRPQNNIFPWDILIKTNGDHNAAIEAISKITLETTEAPEFNGMYMEDQLHESYAEQKRISKILLIFTAIAIIISTLGLFAMSTYYIQQRQMEIAVRKVFGSTSKEVLIKLISRFMLIVGISFIVAIPVIWYAMSEWLKGFEYKISLSPLIFIAAGIVSSVIAVVTVFWQSQRAANTNPIDSIKR